MNNVLKASVGNYNYFVVKIKTPCMKSGMTGKYFAYNKDNQHTVKETATAFSVKMQAVGHTLVERKEN